MHIATTTARISAKSSQEPHLLVVYKYGGDARKRVGPDRFVFFFLFFIAMYVVVVLKYGGCDISIGQEWPL